MFISESRSTGPRLETKISMNFVPWESFDHGPQSKPTGASLKLKRAKVRIKTTKKIRNHLPVCKISNLNS